MGPAEHGAEELEGDSPGSLAWTRTPTLDLSLRDSAQDRPVTSGRSFGKRRLNPRTSRYGFEDHTSGTEDAFGRTAQSDDELSKTHYRRGFRPPNPSRTLPEHDKPCINGEVPDLCTVTKPSVALPELARLLRAHEHQERRRTRCRQRTTIQLIHLGLQNRLVRVSHFLTASASEAFQNEDKETLAMLHNAFLDIRASVEEDFRFQLSCIDSAAETFGPETLEEYPGLESDFWSEIPSRPRDELLAFLSAVRTDPDFVAKCVLSLTPLQLDNLLSLHARTATQASPSRLRRNRRSSGSDVGSTLASAPVAQVLALQRHDPLSILLFSIFTSPSGSCSCDDQLRTSTWSTISAKTFSNPSAGTCGDRLLQALLDIYASMNQWQVKTEFSLYLVEVLRDGQFLLEQPETSVFHATFEEEIAERTFHARRDEFFEIVIQRLFRLIDSSSDTGAIPQGAMEIACATYGKLGDRKSKNLFRRFVIHHWFFDGFLTEALVYPERHGMLLKHYISQAARDSILKPIAYKAQKHVLDMTYQWPTGSPPVPPRVRPHIQNILNLLRKPASSVGRSLELPGFANLRRNTSDIQPWIMLCPSDVVTLVKTLFPTQVLAPDPAHWPESNQDKSSRTSSVSTCSEVCRGGSTPGECSPELGGSLSSMTSDATSRVQLSSPAYPSKSLFGFDATTAPLKHSQPKPTPEYGREIHQACMVMEQILGSKTVAGTPHHSAERWSILYVSKGRNKLDLRPEMDVGYDDHDQYMSDSVRNTNDYSVHPLGCAKQYDQMKDGIAELLRQYDVPCDLAPQSDQAKILVDDKYLEPQFEKHTDRDLHKPHRAPVLATEQTLGASRAAGSMREPGALTVNTESSEGPKERDWRSATAPSIDQPKGSTTGMCPATTVYEPLKIMLGRVIKQCEINMDFLAAHKHHRTLQLLSWTAARDLDREGYVRLLDELSRIPLTSLDHCGRAIAQFDSWTAWLHEARKTANVAATAIIQGIRDLRDRLWFYADVCHSGPYEEAKRVIIALGNMAPEKAAKIEVASNSKQRPNTKPVPKFLSRAATQVLNLMAATGDMCGPNKLSDEQCSKVRSWLDLSDVENLVPGEERLHRFHLETEQCVNRLLGEGIVDAPVLWSSELYQRDKAMLDAEHQRHSSTFSNSGASSLKDIESTASELRQAGHHPQIIDNSLSAASRSDVSRQHHGTARYAASRLLVATSPQKQLRSLNAERPLRPTDIALQSDGRSVYTSHWRQNSAVHYPSSITSSSRNSVTSSMVDNLNPKKRRFLSQLRDTLLALLLSEFQSIAFPEGSETDGWFSSDLGPRLKRVERTGTSVQALKPDPTSTIESADVQTTAEVNPLDQIQGQAIDVLSKSAPATSQRSTTESTLSADCLKFDYHIAFHHALQKFSSHCSLFQKLEDLEELSALVKALVRENMAIRHSTLDELQSSSDLAGGNPNSASGHARGQNESLPIPEAINSVDSSNNIVPGGTSDASSHITPSGHHVDRVLAYDVYGTNMLNTSAMDKEVKEMLVDLLRSDILRPKTLFRDLQAMLTFMPIQMLNSTAGKAFWDTVLAALSIKRDCCQQLVKTADDIVAYHTNNRTHVASQGSSAIPSSTSKDDLQTQGQDSKLDVSPVDNMNVDAAQHNLERPPGPDYQQRVSQYTMADAARMLVICAKEGNATAQRELAIFYLTHDAVVPRVLLPLTKPTDVFKPELIKGQWRDSERQKSGAGSHTRAASNASGAGSGGSAGDAPALGSGVESERANPMIMCLAHHWMECSKRGGDQLAMKYLRDREDMDNISGATRAV